MKQYRPCKITLNEPQKEVWILKPQWVGGIWVVHQSNLIGSLVEKKAGGVVTGKWKEQKKHYTLTHAPSGMYVLNVVPWKSHLTLIAKCLWELQKIGSLSAAVTSCESQEAVIAIPEWIVSRIQKYHAKSLTCQKSSELNVKKFCELIIQKAKEDLNIIEPEQGVLL